MPKPIQYTRRIALFIEGETEQYLPPFIHRWLDPQLPSDKRVGIIPVKFCGISNYLDDLAMKVASYLDNQRANFVVGLVDLYGIPANRIDLSKYNTVAEKVSAARAHMRGLVPKEYRDRFRQHFAVHETEAWLLAYPDELSREKKVQDQIKSRPPEAVNFDEPPAKFLKRVLRGYKKTVIARNLFSRVDPQVAVDKCPFLKQFMKDLLSLAKLLQ